MSSCFSCNYVVTFLFLPYLLNGYAFAQIKEEPSLLVPTDSMKGVNCECGKLTRKIDDERVAKIKVAGGSLPWLAELVTSGDPAFGMNIGFDEYRICIGTVVSLQSVLFPASCIVSDYIYSRTKPMVKLIGIQNRTLQIQEIAGVRFHPGYKRKYDHDLALVKLKSMIDFNRTKVVPICLPPPPKKMYNIPKLQANGSNEVDTSDSDVFEKVANVEEEGRRPCRNPNPPCASRPCPPCPPKGKDQMKKPYNLESFVVRTWFSRKNSGYDYNQHFGRFLIPKMVNESKCQGLFPEMLRSKVECVQQKEIKEIAKLNQKFFQRLELGVPLMLSNTTLVKGKPQPATTKFYLQAMRGPGIGGMPLLESRENVTSLIKISDYVDWIRENSQNSHFCQT